MISSGLNKNKNINIVLVFAWPSMVTVTVLIKQSNTIVQLGRSQPWCGLLFPYRPLNHPVNHHFRKEPLAHFGCQGVDLFEGGSTFRGSKMKFFFRGSKMKFFSWNENFLQGVENEIFFLFSLFIFDPRSLFIFLRERRQKSGTISLDLQCAIVSNPLLQYIWNKCCLF